MFLCLLCQQFNSKTTELHVKSIFVFSYNIQLLQIFIQIMVKTVHDYKRKFKSVFSFTLHFLMQSIFVSLITL